MIRVFASTRGPLLWQQSRRQLPLLRRAVHTGFVENVNVINGSLCDDALSLLRPSLEPYHGCNIIDILPGPGLWSRKIHELLRPQSHIFIDFARNAADDNNISQLTSTADSHFEYHQIESADKFYLKHSFLELLQKLTVSDRPLLVLANFSNHKGDKRRRSGKDRLAKGISPADPFVQSFVEQLRNGIGVHAVAPARLLLWMLDRDKFNFLNRSASSRGSLNIDIEDLFFPQEIVGCSELTRIRRPANLELQSALTTAHRMLSNGTKLPAARRSRVHRAASETIKDSKTSEALSERLLELDRLEARWAFDHYLRHESEDNPSDKRKRYLSAEYRRRITLREQFDNLLGVPIAEERTRYLPYRDDGRRAATCQSILEDLDRSIATSVPQGPLIQAQGSPPSQDFVLQTEPHFGPYTRNDVKQRLDMIVPTLDRDDRAAAGRLTDESRALKMGPPLLAWDQRAFEPLECSAKDFSPKVKLALVDFQPKTKTKTKTSIDYQPVTALPIVRWMKPLLTLTVPEALDAVGNGAAAALLPSCPAIRDPTKGGALDEHNVRVRMLTSEMWREIADAWYRWPFRKSEEELLAELGRDDWHDL